ncbi:MAG: hypothetical protein C5B58_00915, partial [Acidobacteria bacterium]
MKSTIRLFAAIFMFTLAAFAQSDRGTITGTVADPAGAVVSGVGIEARNVDTGSTYQAASTVTGNYTLAELPTGNYEVSVSAPGFKKYVRQNVVLGVAQTVRVDVGLEVGVTTESVTVNEAIALLKTESGELSHNVASQTLDQLPVLGTGATQASSEGIRSPMAAVMLIPGATWSGSANLVRVNGAQGNTNAVRIEGLDASNGSLPGFTQQNQPSVDAIQEISIQTSNFAAEYGQVGGGFFNLTMKSGSNQFHGSAYDYFVNEALNAGQPFTNNGNKGLILPVQRRNDYGFTLGGPLSFPKLYNGHDRTFFFINWEQYLERVNVNNTFDTVPIAAYRGGNFQQALTGRTLATDPLGRSILEGSVYDPTTQRTAPNGQTIRDAFPTNAVPLARMDPVALKIQALIPNPTIPNALINNAIFPFPSDRNTIIPALKVDHSLSAKAKLSFYFSRIWYRSLMGPGPAQLGDGLPEPITDAKGFYVWTDTWRLSNDYSITPTLLLHIGAGFMSESADMTAALTNYDPVGGLGLTGIPVVPNFQTFPKFQGLNATRGGMNNMGINDAAKARSALPTASASLTWVKNNHTFKTGAEMRIQGYLNTLLTNTSGFFNFAPDQTGLPSTNGQNLGGGTVGFPYASFLLGQVNQLTLIQAPHYRLGKQSWGLFAQDTWKVTRKFTLDYGIRYDYSGYFKEQYGRLANFSLTVPNPSAGGLPGAVVFEGSGPGRCNCDYAHNYSLAFAPRLGAAYQITPKTVLRVGWGIVYAGTGDVNGATGSGQAFITPLSAPAFGDAIMSLRNGITLPPSQYQWPNFDPGQFPKGSSLNSPPVAIDQNAGRPARQYQWSIGVQREIFRNLVVEAAYVGNRGVWWNSPGLININALTPARLSAFGLNLNTPADLALLSSRLDSATATARGFNKPPYPNFPLSTTVAQAVRPYPQFGTITTWWSPLGKTWYDSLQMKATKRFSHGLSATGVFSWQKQLALGSANNPSSGSAGSSPVNDVFNRPLNKYISLYDQSFVFNTSINYTLPNLKTNKVLSWTVRDWTIGAYLQYASGLPILAPTANNALISALFRSTYANRVSGQPLFTQDLNCHCFDPNTTFVLNPKAWSDPPAGQFGTAAAYYSDYRQQRRPQENLALGRTFRIRERYSLNLRAEFVNVFNRAEMSSPTATNAAATQTRNPAGQATAGFGWINTTSVAAPP